MLPENYGIIDKTILGINRKSQRVSALVYYGETSTQPELIDYYDNDQLAEEAAHRCESDEYDEDFTISLSPSKLFYAHSNGVRIAGSNENDVIRSMRFHLESKRAMDKRIAA